MVAVSKEVFDSVYRDVPCDKMLHPWASNCIKANVLLLSSSVLGSAKFYSIVYLFQILKKGKKMNRKEEWIKMGEYYLRSTLLGFITTTAGPALGCIIKYTLGKFTYRTYMLIPFFISGIFIYLEPPHRRGLVINLFCNLLIEYYLKGLEKAGYISLTKSKKVLMFMIGSSLLFYLMRLEGDKKRKTPLIWLFTPEKVKRKSPEHVFDVCPHKGLCGRHIMKSFLTYFAIGAGISLVRLILPQIKTPVQAISSVRAKHFKLGLFFGSYIGIYKTVICYLCQKKGFDSAMYALPAGYIAGLSLLFNPSLGLSIASLTAAFKLYSTILYDKKILPASIPLPELLFCISQGILLNARMIDPDVCPSYVFNLSTTISNGKSDLVAKSFSNILRRTI